MTHVTNARLAGLASLFYIAAGMTAMQLGRRADVGEMLELLASLAAIVLAVATFGITRDVDRDIALIGLVCRVMEGVPHNEGIFFYAVGNTAFSFLFLRGRLIPAPLAGFGLLASGVLAVMLPLQRFGLFGGPMNWSSWATWLAWLPGLVFTLLLAFWLLAKGVRPTAPSRLA